MNDQLLNKMLVILMREDSTNEELAICLRKLSAGLAKMGLDLTQCAIPNSVQQSNVYDGARSAMARMIAAEQAYAETVIRHGEEAKDLGMWYVAHKRQLGHHFTPGTTPVEPCLHDGIDRIALQDAMKALCSPDIWVHDLKQHVKTLRCELSKFRPVVLLTADGSAVDKSKLPLVLSVEDTHREARVARYAEMVALDRVIAKTRHLEAEMERFEAERTLIRPLVERKTNADDVPYLEFKLAVERRIEELGVDCGFFDGWCTATGETNESLRHKRVWQWVPKTDMDRVQTLAIPVRKPVSSWTFDELQFAQQRLDDSIKQWRVAYMCTCEFGRGVTESDMSAIKPKMVAIRKSIGKDYKWTATSKRIFAEVWAEVGREGYSGNKCLEVSKRLTVKFSHLITKSAVDGAANRLGLFETSRKATGAMQKPEKHLLMAA